MPTSLSPFPALVLVIAGGQQRGAGQQVGQGVQLVEGFGQAIQLGPLSPQVGAPSVPVGPCAGVQLRGQFGYPAGANVLPHHPAVDLVNAVVVASFPAHPLCYLSAIAPLPFYAAR
jgi:hypothetical protein